MIYDTNSLLSLNENSIMNKRIKQYIRMILKIKEYYIYLYTLIIRFFIFYISFILYNFY